MALKPQDVSKQLILQVNGRFLTQPITGVQRYAIEIMEAFDQILSHNPQITIELLVPPDAPEPHYRNISVIRIGRFSGHLWEQFELPFALDRRAFLFCPGNMAPILSLPSRRVITTIHDLSFRYFPESYSVSYRVLYELLTPIIMKYSRELITVSNSESRAMAIHYPKFKDKVRVIQNGGGFRGGGVSNFGRKENVVLYVGSLSRRKNFAKLIEVSTHIHNRFGTTFWIVGSLPRGLVGAVSEEKLSGISFLGQINSSEELSRLYSSATCFFFPSLYEASPLPPIEAMSFGCPVVTSRIPSLEERCGDAAQYFDPFDVDDMAGSLEAVLSSSSLQEALRCKGFERVKQFTWDHCAKQTLAAIGDSR